MNRIRTAFIAAVIAMLCAASAWQYGRNTWMTIQQSFADEQTEVFSEMTSKATEALKRQPPDVKAAVGFLEYTHGYYPTGTKQTHGSALDRIVERSRSNAESRIIEMLRDATGLDHGADADDWIRELRNHAESDK
ncbi:hypothetical protein [Botrimarina sp.]|uniref:hypothetical protein n=1 Tax=Botrimarina sp. TaxID=2795802 RepID=UPI0032F070F8